MTPAQSMGVDAALIAMWLVLAARSKRKAAATFYGWCAGERWYSLSQGLARSYFERVP